MFKSYPTKQNTPQRMARKRARRDVFIHNKKMAKLRRKTARAARREATDETE